MNFLPFVITFLLLLVIGSSTLFNSVRSTAIEKHVLQGSNRAKLGLISAEAREEFRTVKKEPKGQLKTVEPIQQGTKEKKKKVKPYVNTRDLRRNLNVSKLNIWPILHEPMTVQAVTLYKKGIKLIEILYGEESFFKEQHHPQLARAIIDAMVEKKGETLMELFPKDHKLSDVYYRMMKGTSTNYPKLEEYFKIEECEGKPALCFPFLSSKVLQVILGEKITTLIHAKEKAKWEINPEDATLTKEELRTIVQQNPHPDFDINNIDILFSFEKPKGAIPHAFTDESTQITVLK